mmetsp:Transcript_15387/g.31213  ORF Transcript_15387/g.31213 Transcript_15387/m.31213 type:complete len:202 (-) Transcript_15387:132-737(-)
MDFSYHVAIVGPSGVGKSTFVEAIMGGPKKNVSSSKDISLNEKVVKYEGYIYSINFLDVPGHQRFLKHGSFYCAACTAILFCYDVSDISSFDGIRDWVTTTSQDQDCRVKLLIGLKADIKERTVDLKDATRLAQKYNMSHFQVSSSTGVGVKEIIDAIAAEVSKLIPNPVNPSALLGKNIKICSRLKDNSEFQSSLCDEKT